MFGHIHIIPNLLSLSHPENVAWRTPLSPVSPVSLQASFLPPASVRYRMQNGSGDCKTCSYGPQESWNARPLRYRTIQLRAHHFDTWSYRHTDTSHLQITATLEFGYL